MNDNCQDTLEDLLHELANIMQNLKPSAEFISRSASRKFDKEAIIEHSKFILQNTMLIGLQMDMARHRLNPEFYKFQRLEPRNIHGKFFKAIECFKKAAKEKKELIIDFNSPKILTLIDSHPTIDSLPFILIDNAVKYSPKYSTIEVELEEYDDHIFSRISNQGPHIKESELTDIYTRGFRSEEAEKTGVVGSGLGLNFLKEICDLHKARVNIFCEGNITSIDDIKYSTFVCEIEFPKTNS
ncbi:sensor histidine kinase [Kordia sp.]|uniref:sensor histidine kinase n=1 Tax=Kordia sp. TaxID=1965332 RepID=UPI003B5CCD9F